MSDRDRLIAMERATIEAIAEIDTDPRRSGVSLHRVRRMIREWIDEFTVPRAPSASDMRAVRESVERILEEGKTK